MSAPFRTIAENDELFREGEHGEEMYVVSSGSLTIRKTIDGAERVIAEMGSGEFLGEMAILSGEPRNATATANEETVVLVYDKSTFEDLLHRNPSIAVRMVHKLAERLRETTEKLR